MLNSAWTAAICGRQARGVSGPVRGRSTRCLRPADHPAAPAGQAGLVVALRATAGRFRRAVHVFFESSGEHLAALGYRGRSSSHRTASRAPRIGGGTVGVGGTSFTSAASIRSTRASTSCSEALATAPRGGTPLPQAPWSRLARGKARSSTARWSARTRPGVVQIAPPVYDEGEGGVAPRGEWGSSTRPGGRGSATRSPKRRRWGFPLSRRPIRSRATSRRDACVVVEAEGRALADGLRR
jgi:hypothetical protein